MCCSAKAARDGEAHLSCFCFCVCWSTPFDSSSMCTAVEKRFQKQGSRTSVIVMCVNARIMRLFWLLVSRGARSTDQARGQDSESNKFNSEDRDQCHSPKRNSWDNNVWV